MSSFKHPVGSQSSRVYWRRRASVIAVLLLVVIVIALFAAHAGSGSGAAIAPTATPSAAAAPHATPTVAAPVSGASAGASPAPTSTAGAGSASGSTCTSSDITVKPIADKSSYSSLEQPKISMSITNSSTSACTIDLGSSQQVLTITSGSETYWSSKDCQVNGTHQNVKMAAGQTLTTPAITWDRTRSSTSTCSTTRSSVPAGGASYHLSTAVGSITSTTSALLILN
jgi:hypothetical protein